MIFNQFIDLLSKMNKIISIDLSYCDFFDCFQVRKIMEALNKIDTLIDVKFIQHPIDTDDLNETEGYLEVISKMMKKNLSIQRFVVMEDAFEQKEK